ncbi:MAG: hypothetical protein NZ578_06625 [Candidatus Binatia bacterium]|nr:hypothetical protein [Candidatus Binatia bacterium]
MRVSIAVSREQFFAALTAAGMPEVPQHFSVVPVPQCISRRTLSEIDAFLRLFDRVTTRPSWQQRVTADAPPISRLPRPEVCFFSAWDFHLSPEQGWQLIECNDNGSGFLFAGLINRLFYDLANLGACGTVDPPPTVEAFTAHVVDMIRREAVAFFGTLPDGLFLILDDAESLRQGKFRRELFLLRDLLRAQGWQAAVGVPAQLRWVEKELLWDGQAVAFIVNRSTDFFWQGEECAALRRAYQEGKVYVAPNPFTYATRSDKRLLAFLSVPDDDAALGITPEERAVLSAHVPATYRLQEENVEELARSKEEFFFKPLHGFAGRGVLTGAEVGRTRLRRLLGRGDGYVAQKKVPKPVLRGAEVPEDVVLWTDLRVWAYRGERFLVSGRASRRPDRLDLTPPGGWVPTYVCAAPEGAEQGDETAG